MLREFPLETIIEPLLSWYEGHARVLPWREEPTPYRVWVSEIMLQQTRVEAVKPYFERFMQALPSVTDLAECPQDTLLKLWEGLGYYNRVRNMQTAAKTVVEQYEGRLPDTYEELTSLKGIGSYTAGAIASIAYGKPIPAVDGNVLRVITRVTGDTSDILKDSFKKEMEAALREIMPKDRAGAFNQALMELGATVCVPNGMPKCPECPWNHMCRALAEDTIGQIPVKTKAKARRIEERTVFVLRMGEKVLLSKRPERGLLAGLYEFPNVPGHLKEEEALAWAKEQGIYALHILPLEPAKHIFSHVEWHMIGYAIRVDEFLGEKDSFLFVDKEASERDYPIPAAFSAYTKYMDIRLGNRRFADEEKY